MLEGDLSEGVPSQLKPHTQMHNYAHAPAHAHAPGTQACTHARTHSCMRAHTHTCRGGRRMHAHALTNARTPHARVHALMNEGTRSRKKARIHERSHACRPIGTLYTDMCLPLTCARLCTCMRAHTQTCMHATHTLCTTTELHTRCTV